MRRGLFTLRISTLDPATPRHDQGDVVVLGGPGFECADGRDDPVAEGAGGLGAVAAEDLLQPSLAELLIGNVDRLRDAVGEDDEDVARRKRRGRLPVGDPRDRPEGRAGGTQPFDGARRPKEHRSIVPGVDPGQGSRLLVEDRPEERGEAVRFRERVELRVEIRGEARGAVLGQRHEAAERALQAGHEQGGGQAFSGDVADGDAGAAGFEREEVVVIAGDPARRAAEAVAIQSPDLRVAAREEARLDLFGDLDVVLEPFLRQVPLALEGALELGDDPHEERQEHGADGEIPVGHLELEHGVGVRGEDVLPDPERRADRGAEKTGGGAHEPHEEEHGRDVEGQKRELERSDVVEGREDRDPEQADDDQDPPGLPPQKRDEARDHAGAQYALRWRRPCRSVIQRILMSSESDQFSM